MTNESREALLPCPFCGGDAELAKDTDRPHTPWTAFCKACDASTGNCMVPAEAAAAWSRCAALQQVAEGWQPIETAPDVGVFLVYLPQEREDARIQVARWRKNVKIIGSVFSFDTTAPTLWHPLPAAPTAQGERDA